MQNEDDSVNGVFLVVGSDFSFICLMRENDAFEKKENGRKIIGVSE